MEQINNDQTIKECSNVLGHQIENIPQLDTSRIILVSNVNPKDYRRTNIVKRGYQITSGTISIWTTPTTQDFYLTSINLSMIKDATCDIATGRMPINLTIDGASYEICAIAILTTTAQNVNVQYILPHPLKIDRSTLIQWGATYTVGLMSRSVVFTGYTID